jgi:hypothetical protein
MAQTYRLTVQRTRQQRLRELMDRQALRALLLRRPANQCNPTLVVGLARVLII